MRRRKGRKRRGGLASAGLVLIAAGAAALDKGRTETGVLLIVIGAALLVLARYA